MSSSSFSYCKRVVVRRPRWPPARIPAVFALHEETPERVIRLVRAFFLKVVARGHRARLDDVGRVVAPDFGRIVVASDTALRAPEDQCRRIDTTARVEVG